MKNLRNIFIAMVGLLTIAACETDADTVAEVADEAGLTVAVSTTSNSSILGNPEAGVDLEDAIVTITNAYLNMTVSQTAGTLNTFEKVEIVKSFNGGDEISLGESTTLPYNLEVSSLDELLAGTGKVESDLRIGDVLSFRTKVYKTDGSIYYYNSSMGSANLVVNCASNLAATYVVNYTSGSYPYVVTELGPGYYHMNQMLGWPTSGYEVMFYDTCGILEMSPEWQFSNELSGEGFVDNDGNLVWTSVSVSDVFDGNTYTMYLQ